MNTCCHSFLCMSMLARAGDTHQAAGTEKFWNVIGWWIISIIGGIFIKASTGIPGSTGLIMAAVMTGKRQALRARLGIAPGSTFHDFLLWWCCTPCVVAQEAREVDLA